MLCIGYVCLVGEYVYSLIYENQEMLLCMGFSFNLFHR